MGKQNDVMLDFLRDERRFADLFNGGLFSGECVVNAAELEEAGESYTEFKGESEVDNSASKKNEATVTRTRDIKKRLKSGAELRILAVEEQSRIDYAMPWRCMNYDTLEYGRQVRERQKKNKASGQYETDDERLGKFLQSDRLAPVYTICLYHGEERWNGPRSLRDMMSFGTDEERTFWGREFADYGMRLICVNELKDVSKFTTELKELFALMAYRKDKQGMNRFLEEHEEYQHVDEETARVIGTVMGVNVFMENDERFKEGKEYNMCQAIREMWMDGWNDGLSEGISQGIDQERLVSIRNIMTNLRFTAEQAMDALSIARDEREKYLSRLAQNNA